MRCWDNSGHRHRPVNQTMPRRRVNIWRCQRFSTHPRCFTRVSWIIDPATLYLHGSFLRRRNVHGALAAPDCGSGTLQSWIWTGVEQLEGDLWRTRGFSETNEGREGGMSEEDGDKKVEVKPRWLLCSLQLLVFFMFYILHVPLYLSLSRSFNLVFPFSPPLHFPRLAPLQFGLLVAMAAAW